MEKLSNEVLSLIVAHIYAKPPPPRSRDPFAPRRPPQGPNLYAVISRQWQHVVEAHVFASIKLDSSELRSLASVFNDARRRAILRRLEYNILLPTDGSYRHDRARNVSAFRSDIKKLLDLFSGWECHVSNAGKDNHDGHLELHLLTAWGPDVDASLDHKINYGYLTFDETRLPVTRRFTGLYLLVLPNRTLHPAAMCKLASAMPRLQRLELEYIDPVIGREDLRKEHLYALAAGLKSLSLPELRYLRINREGGSDPCNHSFSCGNFDVDGVDSLNESLRIISQRSPLFELHLSKTILSSHLFHHHVRLGLDTSTWSNLRHFTINAGVVCSNGKWYYTGDPDSVVPSVGSPDPSDGHDSDSEASSAESDDDSSRDAVANGSKPCHEWRNRPDPVVFDPLIEDMADAVTRMPQLHSGNLEIGTEQRDCIGIIIKYAESGQRFKDRPDWKEDGQEDMGTRRWQVWVGNDTEWNMTNGIKQKMRAWVGESGRIIMSSWPEPHETIEDAKY